MKKLMLLGLCLTTSLAAAQFQSVPATPASAAAPQTAPAAQPSREVLLLTAPVGTAGEYVLTTRTSMKMSAPKVEALPGQQVDQEKLDGLRKAMQSDSTPGEFPVQTAKTFYKVVARDAKGTTLLVTTITKNPQTGKSMTIRTTQLIAPDGKIGMVKMESDDPTMQAVLSSLNTEMLNQMQEQGTSRNLYGVPLIPGQAQTQTISLNAQSLLGNLFTALASAPGGEKLIGQVQSTPLSAQYTTTYTGLSPQGQHRFNTNVQYQPWQIKLVGKDPVPTMDIELLSGDMNAVSLYRSNGLPGNATTNMNMKMRVTTEMEGIRVQLTMDMQQNMELQAK